MNLLQNAQLILGNHSTPWPIWCIHPAGDATVSALATLIITIVSSQSPPFAVLPGDTFRDRILQRGVARIEAGSPFMVETAAEAKRLQPLWRQRLLASLGLDPLPARTDLKARVTKKFETETVRVENIVFESAPGLFVTGNLYLPLKANDRSPAVLYVCGHATEVRAEKTPEGSKRVAYGSKVPYQHHGQWFAEHGFACFVIDTLQLGEIEGLHHGTYREGMWWWQSRGYTPAGVELWNAMRALDYLQSRPEIDSSRMGVTGRSGGGATSWWLASTDERVKAAVPVAGLSDLRGHVLSGEQAPMLRGCVTGHCDCMYFHNVGGLDYSHVIALCAPRAVLLGNSDLDPIFPVGGYRRPAAAAQHVFNLLGASDKFALLETKGGHTDTPELRNGAFKWFKRWLMDDSTPVEQPVRPRLDAKELKVLTTIPAEQRNTTAHEWFVPAAEIPTPADTASALAFVQTAGPALLRNLREQTFAAWPQRPPTDAPLLIARVIQGKSILERLDIATEEGLWLPIVTLAGSGPAKACELRLLDEADWNEWASRLFSTVESGKAPANIEAPPQTVVVMLPCRGIGPTRWNDTQPFGLKTAGPFMMDRRLALLGETVASGRVWDIVRVAGILNEIPATTNLEIHVVARGELAVCATYAMLYSPAVRKADFSSPPISHRNGSTMLHVMKLMDIPHATGLAAAMGNRTVNLTVPEAKDWAWTESLTRLANQGKIVIKSGSGNAQ